MKKTLLFAILALSINAFAQSKFPTFNLQHPLSNSMGINQYRMKLLGTNAVNIFSEMNSDKAIKHQTHKPQKLIRIYDSIYQWKWDTLSIGWKIGNKYINMVYDVNHNLISYLYQTWSGSTWVNSGQFIEAYDANNNLTSDLAQNWDGSSWVNSTQYIYTYDANNNQTGYLYQYWAANAWVIVWQMIMTYDTNNNQISELDQNWNGSIWVNSSQYIYAYDANNNLISYLYQTWSGSAWVNSSQGAYTFDAHNNQTSELDQNWDGSTWVNSGQYIDAYDVNNNLISSLYQTWNGSTWVNYLQYIYIYDANNYLISWLTQYWSGSRWVTSRQGANTYDVNNFMQSHTSKSWNTDGTEVTRGDSTYYYFHVINDGINNLIGQNGNVVVYPNPSNGKFKICSYSPISAVEIFNLPGERIYSEFNFNQQGSIDLSGYLSGIYFIKIYSGTNIYYKKIAVR